jgi:hypothetical protein
MDGAGFPLKAPHRDKVGADRLRAAGESFPALKVYNRKGLFADSKMVSKEK